MLNLSLFRHYEVLKRGNTSVRLSLTILAALAATILLFYKLGFYSEGGAIKLNINLVSSFAIAAFFLIIMSVVLGFLVSDSESESANKIISDYFLNYKQVQHTPRAGASIQVQDDTEIVKNLNKATNKLEFYATVTNGLNLVSTACVVGLYLTILMPFISLSKDNAGWNYFFATLALLIVLFLALLYWWFKSKKTWA